MRCAHRSTPGSSTKKIEGRARSLLNKDEDEKDSKHEKRPNEPTSNKTRDHPDKCRRNAVSGKDEPKGKGAAKRAKYARYVKEGHLTGIPVHAQRLSSAAGNGGTPLNVGLERRVRPHFAPTTCELK